MYLLLERTCDDVYVTPYENVIDALNAFKTALEENVNVEHSHMCYEADYALDGLSVDEYSLYDDADKAKVDKAISDLKKEALHNWQFTAYIGDDEYYTLKLVEAKNGTVIGL